MKKVVIEVGEMTFTAQLNHSHTAKAVWKVLPLEREVNCWGDEIYFDIPVDEKLDSQAKEEVAMGTIAYWPTGKTLCIFFGRTPVSIGNRPRAYSPVNIVGAIKEDSRKLRTVQSGAVIRIKRLGD